MGEGQLAAFPRQLRNRHQDPHVLCDKRGTVAAEQQLHVLAR